MLHLNIPADPVNFNVIECIQDAVVTETNGTSRRFLNVWHMGRASGSAPPNLTTLHTNIRNTLLGQIEPTLSDQYAANVGLIRPLDDPTNPGLELTPYWASGTENGDRYASFGAWTMEVVTGLRGRCFRGRKHFGPVPEDLTIKDEIDPATLATFNNAVGAFGALLGVGDGSGGTWNMSVLSRKNSILTGPSIVLTWADITVPTLQVRLGTMRHRKERTGS